MMPPFDVDWILFDLDGTLWDHEGGSNRALHLIAEERGFDPAALTEAFHEANRLVWGELTSGLIDFDRMRIRRFELVLESLMIELGQHDPSDLSEFFFSTYLAHPSYYPDSARVVELAARHARLAILTNGPHFIQDVKLAHFGESLRFFEKIICPEDVGAMKPAEGFFTGAARLLGHPPAGRMLMVGDSWKDDLLVPMRLGWRTAWISGGRGVEAGAFDPNHSFSSIKDLRLHLEKAEVPPSLNPGIGVRGQTP